MGALHHLERRADRRRSRLDAAALQTDRRRAHLTASNPSQAFLGLRRFLDEAMSMSHVYQPLMIRTLLAGNGIASRRDIAVAFLNADFGQIEYYEQIVRRYPHATLKRHGIIAAERSQYRLTPPYSDLSAAERAALIALCDAKVADYVDRRRVRIWAHRTGQLEPVAGSLRYLILSRALGRCEACGASAADTTLHVDHIVPRSLGGSNDPSNLQALCGSCNLEKLNRDDTDFRSAQAAYAHRAADCEICRKEHADPPGNLLAMVVRRTSDEIVIAPRRHEPDYLRLGQAELNALRALEVTEADRAGRWRIRGLRTARNSSAGHCTLHIDISAENP